MMARAFCLILATALLPLSAAISADPNRPAAEAVQDNSASSVPEPANLALLAAGVAGLIIGRHGSRSRRRDD